MRAQVEFYSEFDNEINRFLTKFYGPSSNINSDILKWKKEFSNPVEMAEIIGAYVDNLDDFKINMWISLDEGVFINVTSSNANEIIKYLYERFPY